MIGEQELRAAFDAGAPGSFGRCDDWLLDGYAAVRTAIDLVGSRDFRKFEVGTFLASVQDTERESLRELADLRIPALWKTVTEYDGGCEGCDCGACEGEPGTAVSRRYLADLGQAVYETGHGQRFCIQERYRPLLDGLTVCRIASGSQLGALVGLDDAGKVVVVVMPIRGEPRVPEHALASREAGQ